MNRDAENLIKQLATKAGMVTARKFGKVGVKYTKANVADVVTEADLAANRVIIKGIRSMFPDHDIISEEVPNGERRSKYVWTIDPLDGTRNFVTKMPLFCTMIGFAKDDEMQLATIYDPIHKGLYFAKKGHGAFLNGKRIRCSDTKKWERSFGCGPSSWGKRAPKVLKHIATAAEKEPIWLSMLGSAGIAMTSVASGKRDWAFSLGGGIWDYAPGFLILKEAGCTVTRLDGKDWKLGDVGMVFGNKYLQPKILKLVKQALG